MVSEEKINMLLPYLKKALLFKRTLLVMSFFSETVEEEIFKKAAYD